MLNQTELSNYVRECRDSIYDSVEASGNPDHRSTAGRNPKKIDAHISDWYMYGLIEEWYVIAYDDFKCRVINGWNGRYSASWWYIPRYRPDYTGCQFRDHTHYVRNLDHQPKKIDKTWREHKQFQRDKSKHEPTWRHRGRGSRYKQFCKTQGAREHRAWVRQQLVREDYDQFCDREYVPFADVWRWD